MKLEQEWHVRLGDYAHAALVAADGRILTVVGDRRLDCYFPNGLPAWSRRVETNGIGLMFAHRGSVYLGGSSIQRIEIDTGRLLASRAVDEEYAHIWLEDGVLTFHAEMPDRLVALDLDTLATLWERPDQSGLGCYTHVHGGILCESYIDGDIRFVDPASGEERLRARAPRALGIPNHFQHLHHGDWFCRFDGIERLAFDLKSGEMRWREFEVDRGRQMELGPGSQIAFYPMSVHAFYTRVGNTAYAGDAGLSAYDLTTGALKWRADVGRLDARAAFDDTHACLHTSDGMLRLIDLASGREVARHELPRRVTKLTMLPGPRVVVMSFTYHSDGHELFGLRAIPGQP